jgi:methionine salvage enolase-phosphatase E1
LITARASKSAASYNVIAVTLQLEPADGLFISDAVAELEAASSARLGVLFSNQEGNPARDPGGLMAIPSLSEIQLPVDPSTASRWHVPRLPS